MKACFWKNIRYLVLPNKYLLENRITYYIPQFCSLFCPTVRNYSSTTNIVNKSNNEKFEAIKNKKYDIFRDDDSLIIFDVDEEKKLYKERPELFESEKEDEFEGMNLERGKRGVFDVEELVDILRKENAMNVFVVAVPENFQYVDYMVIVSPLSGKHMLGLAEYIRKLFKRKRTSDDPIPCIEGKGSKEWIALDLGNIALHILSRKARKHYDLETLWTVGPKFDSKLNEKEDPLIALLEQHTSLRDLLPADDSHIVKEDSKQNI